MYGNLVALLASRICFTGYGLNVYKIGLVGLACALSLSSRYATPLGSNDVGPGSWNNIGFEFTYGIGIGLG